MEKKQKMRQSITFLSILSWVYHTKVNAFHRSSEQRFSNGFPRLPSSRLFSDDVAEHQLEIDGATTFESLGLSKKILTAVQSQPGWDFPTPVQALAIPQILSDTSNSIWCESPTGSGKTAAYVLPLLQKLYQKETEGIASIILCPTRELVVQIGHVISNLSHNVGGKKSWQIQTLYGGVPLEPQIVTLSKAIRTGRTIDVVVATPGRLVDVLNYYEDDAKAEEAAFERRLLDALDREGKIVSSLSLAQIEDLQLDRADDDGRASMLNLLNGVQHLIIDEADRLLSRAFESEVDACLSMLTSHGSKDQLATWLFSATFPKSIEPRVDHALKRLGCPEPLRISCANSDRVVDTDVSISLQKRLNRTSTANVIQQIGPASTIHHRAIRLELPKRTLVLRKLLEENPQWDRVLVFVATRYASEHVARKLRQNGIKSSELHGKLDQEARIRRLKSFSKGKIRVLLATGKSSLL